MRRHQILDLSLDIGVSHESLHRFSPGVVAAGALLTESALLAASFPLWETKTLQPNLFREIGLDAALVLVKLVLVLPVVALDDPDLLVSQTGDPADDLVVGAAVLEVRNQVVNRDPAVGELEPSATIDKRDLFLHTISLRACIEHDDSF